jgi:hypothetical protein
MAIHEITAREEINLNRSMRSNKDILEGTFLRNLQNQDKLKYSGVRVIPPVVESGSSIIVGEGVYVLYPDSSGSNIPEAYTLPGCTCPLQDSITTYIYAKFNSGSPIVTHTMDRNEVVDDNFTTKIPIFTAYRYGNLINLIRWEDQSNALPEKMLLRTIDVQRFARTDGLILGEYDTRAVSVTAGTVWYGSVQLEMPDFYSGSTTSGLYLISHDASMVWTGSPITKYNNSQYQTATGLASLGSGKFAVNWVYRIVSSTKDYCVIILGTSAYNQNQALASTLPVDLPNIAQTQSILVGRIIVANGANVAKQIDSSFTIDLAQTSLNHNDLFNLQGGSSDQYYHLTAQQYSDYIRQSNVMIAGSNITLDRTNHTILASGFITITIPSAITYSGIDYNIKNTGILAVTVNVSGSQTIDGDSSKTISSQWSSLHLESDGNNWFIT